MWLIDGIKSKAQNRQCATRTAVTPCENVDGGYCSESSALPTLCLGLGCCGAVAHNVSDSTEGMAMYGSFEGVHPPVTVQKAHSQLRSRTI
jgi:hypothetical protein